MKSHIQSYALGILMVIGGFFGLTTHAAASVTFNNDIQDRPTLRVVNATQNPNCSSCWVSSVTANPGDTITVDVYYHNTGTQTANGTNFKLTQSSSGAQTNHSINVAISASNLTGAPATGSISIAINGSAQTLTPISGSGLWYPNQGASSAGFLYGQTGNEIVGAGVTIGSLAPGWATQGHITYKFRVGSTVQTFACNNGADDDLDGLVDMNDPGCSSSNDNDETNVIVAQLPIVVTQNATNIGEHSVTLNGLVNPNGNTTNSFFKMGTSASNLSMSYSVAGTQSVTSPISTTITGGLSANTTYYYQACATNTAGTRCGSTLYFTTNTTPTQTFACNNGADDDLDGLVDMNDPGCSSSTDNDETNVITGQMPSATTLSATSVTQYGAILNGYYSDNGANLTNTTWFEWGTTNSLGSYTAHVAHGSQGAGNFDYTLSSLSPNTTYYFKACVSNANGTICGSTLPFTTLSQTQQGSSPSVATIGVSGVSCTSATFNGSYTANSASTNTWIEYGTTPSFGQTTGQTNQGTGSGNFTAYANNLQSSTSYYYRAVAQNSYGVNYGQMLNFQTTNCGGNYGNQPYATTQSATNVGENSATLNGYVDPQGSCTSYFFQYGTSTTNYQSTSSQSTNCGTGGTNVSQYTNSLSQNTTYYFRVVATNNYGTAYGNWVNFYTTGQNNNSQLQVATLSATSVGRSAARMNGLVSNNAGTATTWFEWGGTQNLGFSTNHQYVNGYSQSFSDAIYGLSSNTTYYFRAVAQNTNGTVYGTILTFTTATSGSNVVYVSTGGGNAKPYVELSITTPFVTISPCDRVTYTVNYKNISGSTLRNVVLNVALPTDVTFSQATNGVFSEPSNALQVLVGTLVKNQSGTVMLEGKLRCGAHDNDLIVATSTIAFTIPGGAQDDAIAYASATVNRDASFLAGLALFGDGFFPTTLVGWLLLILIILVLIYIARRMYVGRPSHE
jgi:uncharacterized repeat protein (TIGR01451 family)